MKPSVTLTDTRPIVALINRNDTLPQTRSARLTYDDGTLEITRPLAEHEFSRCMLEHFVVTLVELADLRLKTMGSTTMNYSLLRKSAEPDNAYYIQTQPLVKGRNVDFAQDPPPDLVVEVDITHTDIAKNQFYASLGVPEFWRFCMKPNTANVLKALPPRNLMHKPRCVMALL